MLNNVNVLKQAKEHIEAKMQSKVKLYLYDNYFILKQKLKCQKLIKYHKKC